MPSACAVRRAAVDAECLSELAPTWMRRGWGETRRRRGCRGAGRGSRRGNAERYASPCAVMSEQYASPRAVDGERLDDPNAEVFAVWSGDDGNQADNFFGRRFDFDVPVLANAFFGQI